MQVHVYCGGKWFDGVGKGVGLLTILVLQHTAWVLPVNSVFNWLKYFLCTVEREIYCGLFICICNNLNICAQVREMSRTVNAAQMKLVEGEEGDKLELASLMEVTIFFTITIIMVVNFFIIITVFITTMIMVIAIIKLSSSLNFSSSRC